MHSARACNGLQKCLHIIKSILTKRHENATFLISITLTASLCDHFILKVDAQLKSLHVIIMQQSVPMSCKASILRFIHAIPRNIFSWSLGDRNRKGIETNKCNKLMKNHVIVFLWCMNHEKAEKEMLYDFYSLSKLFIIEQLQSKKQLFKSYDFLFV